LNPDFLCGRIRYFTPKLNNDTTQGQISIHTSVANVSSAECQKTAQKTDVLHLID